LGNVSTVNGTNAIAIGWQSAAMNNDQMILGNNSINVGIGLSTIALGPRNKLEINAINGVGINNIDPTAGPNSCGGTGWSGLQFRDLTTASTPCTNPSTNVLTVDANGNVILVPDGTAGTLPLVQNALNYNLAGTAIEWGSGQAGGPALTPLLHNTEIMMRRSTAPVGEFNIYFTGQGTTGGSTTPVDIGIGHTMNTALHAKLDVYSTTQTTVQYNLINKIAGKFHETGSYDIDPSVDEFVGVMGISDVTQQEDNKGWNLGGDFYARHADGNIGARGTADEADKGNVGIWAVAVNGASNIGVKSMVEIPYAASTNIGVFADVGPPGGGNMYGVPAAIPIGVYGAVPFTCTGNIAIFGDLGPTVLTNPCTTPPPLTAPDYAGYFNGDLVYTTASYAVSDETLKSNIQGIENPMDIINQLNPKSYTFNREDNLSMQLAAGTHYGLIAQELEEVLPQLVKDGIHPARVDADGEEIYSAIDFKAINYTELIPFLIAGMKQQQQQIEEQQAQIEALNDAVFGSENSLQGNGEQQENRTQSSGENSNAIDVTLSSKTIVLDQNQPNPFKEQTTISYFIPDDSKNVKIIFTDSRGNVMKEVEIRETGKGQLNVYAQDLSTGTYTYTLVADGVTIDSKKMVCTK
jgi:hypothetical protein